MAKRAAREDDDPQGVSLKAGDRPVADAGVADGEEFEDEFEDEYESEDDILEAGVDGRPDEEREAEEKAAGAMDVDQDTFIPGRHQLEAGQTLAPDLSAYELLHTLEPTWPCLSFDIVKDNLGDSRKSYPATVYAVAGTQAEQNRAKENQIMVMKLSGLSRNDKAANIDSDAEDDDDEEFTDTILETKSIRVLRSSCIAVPNSSLIYSRCALLSAILTCPETLCLSLSHSCCKACFAVGL